MKNKLRIHLGVLITNWNEPPDPRRFVQVNVKTKSRRNVRLIFTRNRCEEKKKFLGGYKRIPISSLPDKYKDFVGSSLPMGTMAHCVKNPFQERVFRANVGRQIAEGLPATVKIRARDVTRGYLAYR